MALVAILSARSATDSARDDGVGGVRRGELHFAGQTLVEYQARQAHAAGASAIAILVDDVSPPLTRAIDRLDDDGIHASLVRDMPALGRMIAMEDAVLLIGDGHVLPSAEVAALAEAMTPTLLILAATPMTRAFERIDSDHVWAGGLRARAASVLTLVDMLGDWDLSLALMRHVVQEGAQRRACDVAAVLEGHIAILSSPAAAEAATRALATGGMRTAGSEGNMDDWPVGQPAALLAPLALRYEVRSAVLRAGAIAMGILGLLALVGGWSAVGLLLCFGALIADRVAALLDKLLRLSAPRRPIDRAVVAIALVAVVVAGLLGGGGGVLAAAGAIITAGLLALHRPGAGAREGLPHAVCPGLRPGRRLAPAGDRRAGGRARVRLCDLRAPCLCQPCLPGAERLRRRI